MAYYIISYYIILFCIHIVDHPYVEVSHLVLENVEKSCILIGVLYKDQQMKPSLLHDLSKELQLEVQPINNYASINDKLFLEDETLRIKLVGNHIDIQEIVTGIVCAVLGHELENGTFWVYIWYIFIHITDLQIDN